MAVQVEPGVRLVWGATRGEWFEFKRGRTYLLLYIGTGQFSSAWFMENPDIIRPFVLQEKLAHVMTPEAGLERLRAKLENKYKKALKQAGSKGEVVLPKRFSPAKYGTEGTRMDWTWPSRHSALTINEKSIEYKSKKKEVVIPVSDIQQVSLGRFGTRGFNQPWIRVSHGRAEAPKNAYFVANNYNSIFASIMAAMEIASGRKDTSLVQAKTTETVFSEKRPREQVRFDFDGRNWSEGYSTEQRNQTIREFVLPGETVENWTELVTIHTFWEKQPRMTPKKSMRRMKEITLKDCPDAMWNVITESKEEVLFEWQTTECPDFGSEYEVSKIIRGKMGIHRLAYTNRKLPISEEQRNRWIDLMERAKLELVQR